MFNSKNDIARNYSNSYFPLLPTKNHYFLPLQQILRIVQSIHVASLLFYHSPCQNYNLYLKKSTEKSLSFPKQIPELLSEYFILYKNSKNKLSAKCYIYFSLIIRFFTHILLFSWKWNTNKHIWKMIGTNSFFEHFYSFCVFY